MIKKYIKILVIISTIFPLLNLPGCKLPDESEPALPPVTYETGMWYVGKLITNGDARYVNGFIINSIQYAFLADGQKGFEIINISNPLSPALTYSFATNGFAKEVYIDSLSSNKYAFLSDEVNGLYILDVTNPSNPVLDTALAYSGGVNSSYMYNGYLYAALKQGVIKIINVKSLPDSVFEVSTYTPGNPVEHIEISGSNAYLLEKTYGFEILSLANPEAPTFLSIFNTSGGCYNLKIGNDLAYIADGTAGVCVVNVGNPSQPYFVEQTNTESDVRGIDYSPNYMFTAEYSMGAEVFNLFNPTSPYGLGYYETPGYCYGVHYFKGKVLIANGTYGLLILRF
jgi:hypothetical protein